MLKALHKTPPMLTAARTTAMTTLLLVLFLHFNNGFKSDALLQNKALHSFTEGETVKLECLLSSNHENFLYWFKQELGEAPECMLSLYSASSEPRFFGDFNKDGRFSVYKDKSTFVLTIADAQPWDAGIYYCGARDYELITFSTGMFLSYQGIDLKHKVKQFSSGLDSRLQNETRFNAGDSANLQCSVLSERCAEHNNVYWFKHEPGETHPGIIYMSVNPNDQCPNKDSRLQSCTYNLPKRNLSLNDAGTYYCAVALCGEILFGSGSRLDVAADPESSWTDVKIQVLITTNVLCLLIICVLLCKRGKKTQEIFLETQPMQATAPSPNEGVQEDIDYAAVHFSGRNRQKDECNTQVIYSTPRVHSLK